MDIRNTAKKETLLQFIRFCIVGFSNTCFSYFIYVLVLFLLRSYKFSLDYVIAGIISFLLGTLWAFFWSSKFVFRVQHRNMREVVQALLKSYATYSFTGILLGNLFAWILIEQFGVSRYLTPLLFLCISVPTNYLLNRFWTFKRAKQTRDSKSGIGGDVP